MDITHLELDRLLTTYSKADIPIILQGEPGIGKTEHIEAWAAAKAAEMGRQFLRWQDLSQPRRKALYDSPDERKKTFLFATFDLLVKQAEDLAGIPRHRADYCEWVPTMLCWVFSQPESAGVAFFDEFQQAGQSVQKPIAGLFNDHVLAELRFSKDIYCLGATNRTTDKCGCIEMLEHLKSRVGHYNLKRPDAVSWSRWAVGQTVSDKGKYIDTQDEAFKPRVCVPILGLINWKNALLYQDIGARGGTAYCCPRTWVKASRLLEAAALVKQDGGLYEPEQAEMLVAGVVGVPAASELKNYITLVKDLDCEAIFNDPSRLQKLKLDEKIAVACWAAGFVTKTAESCKKLLRLSAVLLDSDYGMLTLSMAMARQLEVRNQLINLFKTKEFQPLCLKYKALQDSISEAFA